MPHAKNVVGEAQSARDDRAPEGVGVDDAGNVYAGWTAKMAVRRYVKQ
jgi:hypothetical protein